MQRRHHESGCAPYGIGENIIVKSAAMAAAMRNKAGLMAGHLQ